MQNYQFNVLENGIRLVTEDLPYVSSVTIGVWVNTGSQNENAKNNGISHFIEHLMFQGTSQRSAKEIAETIDAVGGQINAFTSKEHTCFYIRILDKYLSLAIDVLSDMLNHSLFDAAGIEKEKKVIIEEIKMYEDSPDELVHDFFAQCLWGDHPLGRPIAGMAENIKQMTREDILAYFQHHYGNENIVIAVAGNLKEIPIQAEILKRFQQKGSPVPVKQPCSLKPVDPFYVKEKENEQIHLCMGTRAYDRLQKRERYALIILEGILGGGVSSRLFQKVREERGLVYSIYDYYTAYEDTGAFCIYAGTSPDNIEEVVSLVVEELLLIKQHGVEAEELFRTKEQIKGSMMLGLESTNNRMSRLAKCELYYNKIIPLAEVVANIEQVTKEDILQVARELFVADQMVFTAVGSISAEKQANIRAMIKKLS